jgi:hypothetical protein
VKKFVVRLSAFIAINFAVFAALVAFAQSERHNVKNSQVEANLPVIPSGQHFDLLIMGTSRGRALSRYSGHERTENVLGMRMLNISKGRGGGVIPQEIFLSYFFDRGNTAGKIVYLVDPFVFFSRHWNEDNLLAEDEPLQFDFWWKLVRSPVSPMVVHNYFASKFTIEALFFRERSEELDAWVLDRMGAPRPDGISLQKVDPILVKKQIANLYPDATEERLFRRYAGFFCEIIQSAQSHGAEIVLIIPPTLLGECPGESLLRSLLADCERRYGIRSFDLGQAILDPSLYCDHGHLNPAGVEYFARTYLKPVLAGTDGPGLIASAPAVSGSTPSEPGS